MPVWSIRRILAWLFAGLLIGTASLHGSGSLIIIDDNQSRPIGLSDLAGGAGSDYVSTLVFNTTFTLQVTSSGACQVWAHLSPSGPWLSPGSLHVQILQVGPTLDPRPPVEIGTSDVKILESPSALAGEIYTLRYQLQGVSVQTLPGDYSADIIYTITDA